VNSYPVLSDAESEMVRVLRLLYILSEYQPQNKVIAVATAPPGVDRIKVCLELGYRYTLEMQNVYVFGSTYVYPKPLIIKLLTAIISC
jgi:hypothetical protein